MQFAGLNDALFDLLQAFDDVDSDYDGSTLTYSLIGGDAGGLVNVLGSSLVFDPVSSFQSLNPGERATVDLLIRATDKHGAFVDGRIVATITGSNDSPTLGAFHLSATEDYQVVAIDLSGLADDVDEDDTGSTLTYSALGYAGGSGGE